MLKKSFMEQINNDNHYTVPKYILSYAKEFNLDMNSLILLIYLINQKNKDIFDYHKIVKDISLTDKELMESLSKLKDIKALSIITEKNDAGVLEERIDISSFYDVIFSKFLNEEEKQKDNKNLYDTFEREFGRTLSPMEYEIINGWLESKISEDLIVAALKETVFNGVNNLRYVDKILYEWNKKGIKKSSDITNHKKKDEDERQEEIYEYDWLNE